MMKIENTFFIVCVIDRFEIRCISFFYGQPFTQMEYIPSKKKCNSNPFCSNYMQLGELDSMETIISKSKKKKK